MGSAHITDSRPKDAGRRLVEMGSQALFWLTAAVLAVLGTWANLDLSDLRAGLFMDEVIPFDNIKRIITAPSPEALGFAIADGGDHRYGRIFYNISALSGWLPYRLAGDPGLIIAIRSTQVALLVGAMAIFCLGLLRTWGVRVFALLAMACLPYTDYYLTQPKPEPTQLLWYALFMLFAVRRRFAFGWHWIFLGLAFGTKISAAPFCAAAALLAVAHSWIYSAGWKRTIIGGAKATFAFWVGWIIAIPMLALPTRERVSAYLGWTFKTTGHGTDDSRITILDWLKSLLTGGDVVGGAYPPWVAITLFSTVFLVLAIALFSLWRRRIALRDLFETQTGWFVLGLAAALLLPIMLAVKRLWGFYLYPGQIFAVVAVAGIAGQWLAAPEPPAWMKLSRRAALAALAALMLTGCYFSGRAALKEYNRLAHRTRDPAYIRNLAVYESAVEILTPLARKYSRENGRPLDVVYDPFLFLPDRKPDWNVQPFWFADVGWGKNPPVLVIGRKWHLSYFLREQPLPPATAANYRDLATAVEKFQIHVERDPTATSSKPYQLVRWFGDDAALVLRQDIAEGWRKLSGPGAPLGGQR
jgi:hypothetical protein